MDFITSIILLLLFILCLPALIIRGGLRRQLAELERKLAVQGSELSTLRAEVSRLGRSSGQGSAALSPLPAYIPSNVPLPPLVASGSNSPVQAGSVQTCSREVTEDQCTAGSALSGILTGKLSVGNVLLMYGP